MEESIENPKKSLKEQTIIRFTSLASYIFPFITVFPNTAWWFGIMVFPFFYYILLFISNPQMYPIPTPDFGNPVVLVIIAIVVVTILYLSWSVVLLHRLKGVGLVTTGPYRLVRHPQYLSFIIITGIMTLLSAWILPPWSSGIGWYSPIGFQITWIVVLTCYALFAKLEERFLSNQYQEELATYKNEVGFFIPGVKSKNDIIEILSGILIPFVIFFVVPELAHAFSISY